MIGYDTDRCAQQHLGTICWAGKRDCTGQPAKLYYYQQRVGFHPVCAITSVGLLTQQNGSGECGAWRQLFLDSLAVNRIEGALQTAITAADGSGFLVKDWTNGTPSSPNTPPNYWRETFATTPNSICCEMGASIDRQEEAGRRKSPFSGDGIIFWGEILF